MKAKLSTTSKILYAYAFFLIASGVTGYVADPAHARTAIVLGALGGAGILWLARQAGAKAQWAGSGVRTLVGVFSLTFVWRAVHAWMKVQEGDRSMSSIAAVLSLMFAVSLFVLLRVARSSNAVK